MEIIYSIAIIDSDGSLLSYDSTSPVIPRLYDRINIRGTNYLVYRIVWSYNNLLIDGIIYITVVVGEYKERS